MDGAFTQSAGVTNVATGAHLNLLYVSRTISLAGGVLEGAGTIGARVANIGGTVKPGGTATGTLHISGSYIQDGQGTLALDLAAKTHDVLAIKGAVSLAGTLTAHDIGSYHPSLGTKYRVLVAASIAYTVSCATSSGTGSSSGHWAPSHTSASLYVRWRSGARTSC